MLKRSISCILICLMIIVVFPISVMGVTLPNIYREEVSVRVGNSIKVDFTYGDTANKADIIVSSPGIQAHISGKIIYIDALTEGLSYVTLQFDDGTMDSVAVNVVSKYTNIKDKNFIEILNSNSKNLYIDLNLYDATYATFTCDNSVISLNKTRMNSSGTLKITGKKSGSSILKVDYNTGESEVYHIEVVDKYSQSYSDNDVYLNLNQSFNYYINLKEYNATKATVSYSSNNVKVNRSTFTTSGDLVITAKRNNSTEVTIEYNTGDIEVLNIICEEDYDFNSFISTDYIEVKKDKNDYFYVFLGEDATNATLTMENTRYATLSSYSISNSSRISIKGVKAGETNLRVSFNDGSKYIIPIVVSDPDYFAPTVEIDNNSLTLNEVANLELYMGSANNSVTLTIDNPEKIDLDIKNYNKNRKTYTINSAKERTVNVKITAIDIINSTYITVKYPEGKTYKISLSISDFEKVDGRDKKGNNFVLRKGLSVNQSVLDVGYIEGYGNNTFGPFNNITRQEFGVILSRILEFQGEVKSEHYLSDVTATWSKDSIAKIVAMGIINKNELFRPNDYITRYEVAQMLYNVIDLSNYSTSCRLIDVNPNTSLGEIVAKSYNAGLISGYSDGSFGGINNITRAEAVTLINRIFYSNLETDKINRFVDVSEGFWAYHHIVKASRGI